MRNRPTKQPKNESGGRLQKVLAQAGVASRRAAEEMIAAGRISVNGKVVTEMGVRADLARDVIEVDGRRLGDTRQGRRKDEHVYIALNKPVGVVSTAKDTHGRPTVVDLVQGSATADDGQTSPKSKQRIYPVGRLDADTTGLILLTNDGELTHKLTHPRYGVEKEYRALVRGRPSESALRNLREGVVLEGAITAPAHVEAVGRRGSDTWLRVVIHEGRKRQVRLMTASVGHPIIELQRVRFGPVALGNLAPGKWRYLKPHEVQALRSGPRNKGSEAGKRG